jgi:glycosyltransferase involved in cell wall biosynthesis
LITIVTVVFNSVNDISKTIESIIRYKNPEIEYIVIDGGSNDGTLEIIYNYKKNIDIIISESDRGIYDAMNKSILKANGFYLININCGDILLSNPFDYLKKEDILSKNYDLILFNVLQSNGVIYNNQATKNLKFHNTIHHQGVLYKANKNELYDISFKVFADFDLNQRIFKKKPKILKIDKSIVEHNLDGISHSKSFFYENYLIVKKNYGFFFTIITYLYFKKQGLIDKFR